MATFNKVIISYYKGKKMPLEINLRGQISSLNGNVNFLHYCGYKTRA